MPGETSSRFIWASHQPDLHRSSFGRRGTASALRCSHTTQHTRNLLLFFASSGQATWLVTDRRRLVQRTCMFRAPPPAAARSACARAPHDRQGGPGRKGGPGGGDRRRRWKPSHAPWDRLKHPVQLRMDMTPNQVLPGLLDRPPSRAFVCLSWREKTEALNLSLPKLPLGPQVEANQACSYFTS
ncbi:hypothetical protein GQ53DRAFT_162837 [Thozetella sp. PMI_491]|nr:hypothetical protein GQ53DRAFT_162837 [Thozetella sp. PMI_491]